MADDLSTSRLSPSVSIVVVSYNTAAHIEACLLSLLELHYPGQIEIIVVDNASTDGSVDLVRRRFPDVELVELPDNKGFAGGASVGMYMASGDIVATVNPDVKLHPNWLLAVADTLGPASVGIVGSKILYPDGKTIQHAGGVVDYPLATTSHIGRGEPDSEQYNHPKAVQFVTGAALAMRRDVGHALGFFDADYYPVFYEDVDLCWRANKEGFRTIYQPKAIAYHKESITYNRQSSLYYSYYHANRLRFVVKRYSAEQVMLDFLPAEAARVAGDMQPEDRRASLSLLDNHAPTAPEEDAQIAHRWKELKGHVDSVIQGWHVYESAHPAKERKNGVTGKARNLLSRLYAWPTMRKQIDYNASLARTLREISRQLSDLQARVALQSVLTSGLVSKQGGGLGDVAAELEALRGRIEQLEGESERQDDYR
ncbi:MAG TPA: glycosyltransferase family 2 protein [Chloroflexia bacterium]|nr:glycosyltransferase family 2 protein [Chloroflexia bacterium]